MAVAAPEVPRYLHSFGPDGTEASFESANSIAVDQGTGEIYVLDRRAGALYKFDANGNPVAFTGSALYISGNRIEGLTVGEYSDKAQVAVDSSSHVVYITEPTSIRAFGANGEAAEFTAGPGAGTSEIGGFAQLSGVGVDIDGNIYGSDLQDGVVKIYASSGESLTEFAAQTPNAIAVDDDGNVYVDPIGINPLIRYTPSETPVSATTTYTASEPIPKVPGIELRTGFGVDPLGDVYSSLQNGEKGTWIAQRHPDGTLVREFTAEGVPLNGGIAVVKGGESFYASSTLGSFPNVSAQVAIFGPQPPGPPEIGVAGAYDVSADAARLQARINPRKVATTYRFEYGLEDCALPESECVSIPVPDAPLGKGNEPISVSQAITGLAPGTTYHLRVFAVNAEGTDEVNRTFTTQTVGGGFGLADSRVWELVSPPKKGDGAIIVNNQTLIQASTTGDSLAYLSRGAMEEDPEGNRSPELSNYLAGRSTDGSWASKDITSTHSESNILQGQDEFFRFSEDLSKALIEPRDETLLSPEATEYTPYIRDNTTTPPTYTPILTEANVTSGLPWGQGGWGQGSAGAGGALRVVPVGASPDLDQVALVSKTPLLEGVAGSALYLWSGVGGALEAVSQLPPGEGGKVVEGGLGSEGGSIRHAISGDGARVFWQTGDYSTLNSGITKTALYVRSTETKGTTRLDVAQDDATEEGRVFPAFQDATPDGRVVFFTDSQQLTSDASPGGRDLYRCELGPNASEGCVTLEDISAPAEGSGEEARVKELVPAISEDGTRAYFVAEGVLDSAPNASGETAVKDQPNLYLWEEGPGARFVAELAPGALPTQGDSAVWGVGSVAPSGRVAFMSSYASPNGRFFTFTSQRPLTGYANESPRDGTPLVEVFVYDAETDSLQCASCIPTGAGPIGTESPAAGQTDSPIDPQLLWAGRQVSATLPEASNSGSPAIRQPRVAHDNGRVFFNAFDPLVAADTNANWDVYQYQPIDTGSCTPVSAGAAVARTPEGCVSLVSSGSAEGQSAFMEASPGADNVFFLTKGRLSVLDKDDAVDVYDARVDGIEAVEEPRSECAGESCQAVTGPPSDPTPASEAFRGPGNVFECPKGKRKVVKGGTPKCVAKHKKKKHHKKAHKKNKRAASKSGRAAR
ncbi:MAG TPA: hypothetical protein VFN92_02175 [Solirubrobacterales bacterium]|nr:hypothetical protein [Solirubrobacterales bacterium]